MMTYSSLQSYKDNGNFFSATGQRYLLEGLQNIFSAKTTPLSALLKANIDDNIKQWDSISYQSQL